MEMTENLQLVSIELNNFKSFKGVHKVSPLTDFTSVVGPNGSGKSNIIDAVAFALFLPLLPAKHAHTRELVYRANQQMNSAWDMHVQLNFTSCSFRRSYTDGIHEYTFLADGKHEKPMTADEYKDQVARMNLDISEFCHYQDRLLNQFNKSRREALTQTFEALSGSTQFKEEYDALKTQISGNEQDLREVSDRLKDKRHEKIKMRGLADYQKEIEKCVTEQVKCSKLLSAVQLLSLHQKIKAAETEEKKFFQVSDQNFQLRNQCLQEVKRSEANLRVLDNKILECQTGSRKLRSDLIEIQTSNYQSEKTSESAKYGLTQKRQVYQQLQADLDKLESNRASTETQIKESSQKLALLEKKIQESPELASEQALRDQYLDIKAKLQSENAQIERETCKIESKMQVLIQKQALASNNLKATEGRLGSDTVAVNQQLQASIKQATGQLEAKQEQINGIRKDLASLQQQSTDRKNQLQVVEKNLLEGEFELSELESEKNLKSQDVRLQQILAELRQRCRGYKGQFYELVKPINPSYDIAVKVSLSKCLKMLVVEDTDAAQICSDFLKEKSISLEVLVLSNVPDRQFSNGISNKIQQVKGASLIYDVIEVPRSEQALERAVRYFAGDKVFVKDFKQATEIQKKGVKDIITEDGTHFQQGMISGGQHQNIFKLQFGTNQLDKQIVALVEKISKLEAQHFSLKQSLKDEFMQKETVLLRDLQGCELEVEQLRTKKQVLEKQLESASQNSKGLNQQYKDQQKEFDLLANEVKQLRETKKELSADIRQIETKYFAEFCKTAGVKSVLEYENRLFGREDGDKPHQGLLQEQAELKHLIARGKTDLTFAKQQETSLFNTIEGIKQSIFDEEQKLKSVATGQAQQAQIQKMQDQLRETEELLQVHQKERSTLHAKQVKQRQELEMLTLRDEVILKDKNTCRIQLRREQNSFKEMIEQVKMNKSIDGVSNFETEDELIGTAVKFLDQIGGQEIRTDLLQSEVDLKQKVSDLEKMEEQFNAHVAVIPESDDAALQLTTDILGLKDSLEQMSSKLSQLKLQLAEVKKNRSDRFLDYFNKVSATMPDIYRDLTGQIGTSSLLITDSVDLPFESQILFDFCPPGKRHGADIDQLSGGEKSMAALSFIFALAKISSPPLVILDEVDAFLDGDNVDHIANYLAKQRKTQILIVSHKEELASRGKSLIGICANKAELTSQSFSLDLQQFDK